ncbi:MAG: hypothetical protein COW00_06230 [Bdellovibrio sp. CG12_big_fil_rev_8_21_14_0_65_39_13]|nr:MAG: hypothetical protein COW78_18765 [Bdellovibrio sp. CG22_combo_CG10-13_8_21_14_all_39_27]PIQ60820.1 MAG: hypothetical protein COW00_06230 [Bdellovibrio sp. CG12_big_fil_rev_8_21_14_0_65_39_13]PIR36444.1 MAG: hypothetical protein COV37_03570 [Bdellovibrio sp. CG11_big_fil_rev_8_21_14_0_20_39_38]
MQILRQGSRMKTNMNKNFVIIQMARTGDLIQTLSAANAFKANHPDINLSLVARERYAAPIKSILEKTFSRVFTLSKKSIFNSSTTEEIVNKVDDFLTVLNCQSFDVALNLSFCKTSFYITTLINTPHKLGNYYSSKHELVTKDLFTQYLSSFVVNSSINSFNINDIWLALMGGRRAQLPERKVETKEGNFKEILLHPFASQERKHWKTGKWVEVIYLTLKNNQDTRITICGSKEDQPQVHQIINDPILKLFKNRLSSVAGILTISELHEKMDRYNIFVGHDSMVSHLASLKNIPTVTFPVGSVRPHETAPLGVNTIVATPKTSCFPCYVSDSCQDFDCHKDISHQLASELITIQLRNKKVDMNEIITKHGHYHAASANIYIGKQNPDGLYQLVPTQETISTKTIMRDLYQILWTYKFFESSPRVSNPIVSQSALNELSTIKSNLHNLFELSEFAKKYCTYILQEINSESPNITNINDLSAKIDEIDRLSNMIKKASPELGPLVSFYEIQKANTSGTTIVEITENTYLVYHDISVSCSVLDELLDKIINTSNKNKNIHQGR